MYHGRVMTQDTRTTLSGNVPEFSVSEISQAIKGTLESGFGQVRVRGELSRVKIYGSGHLYTALKDDRSVLEAVCWRGVLSKLSVKPEEGLEVICTGRITSYPGRSQYQLVIDGMELAGEGALLKLLEERRKRLAAEGLFDTARKRPLPFMPRLIGVVTSPSGAVIRDILHRIADRFPTPVLLWPVTVQGETAAKQIVAAVEGFNALPPLDSQFQSGRPRRPDILIVGRGGGSLEDLMPFNEEGVVRAVAASSIPVISAVGHETDTTLIDFAADLRAPTPTAAAEQAVPVRAELAAFVAELEQRLNAQAHRQIDNRRIYLEGLGRGLVDPARVLENAMQTLDDMGHRLDLAIEAVQDRCRNHVQTLAGKMRSPREILTEAKAVLKGETRALDRAGQILLRAPTEALEMTGRLLESLSYRRTLERGFVLVRDETGKARTRKAGLNAGAAVSLSFADGEIGAVIDGAEADSGSGSGGACAGAKAIRRPKKPKSKPKPQGELF